MRSTIPDDAQVACEASALRTVIQEELRFLRSIIREELSLGLQSAHKALAQLLVQPELLARRSHSPVGLCGGDIPLGKETADLAFFEDYSHVTGGVNGTQIAAAQPIVSQHMLPVFNEPERQASPNSIAQACLKDTSQARLGGLFATSQASMRPRSATRKPISPQPPETEPTVLPGVMTSLGATFATLETPEPYAVQDSVTEAAHAASLATSPSFEAQEPEIEPASRKGFMKGLSAKLTKSFSSSVEQVSVPPDTDSNEGFAEADEDQDTFLVDSTGGLDDADMRAGRCAVRRDSSDGKLHRGTSSQAFQNGKPKKQKKQKRALIKHVDSENGGFQSTRLQRLISSKFYEAFSAVLILSNTVFIGWQAQYLAEFYRDQAAEWTSVSDEFGQPPIVFLVLNAMFAILFFFELFPRWIGEGFCDFFRSHEIWWNVLDVVVVFAGLLELGMDLYERASGNESGGDELENISVMKMLRILRVVRVVRVIRVMKFFRELRMMVYSIIGSMKNLMWVMVILGATFYVFGIVFTSGVTSLLTQPSHWKNPKHEDLKLYFGTVDRSILTLFMAMSGGNDWIEYYRVLVDMQPFYRVLFLSFISFTLFAIVNIVTGVFVEAALAHNLKDRDIIAHEEQIVKKQYLEAMQDIFVEMDTDEGGNLSLDEFEAKVRDDRVIAYFNALKLDVTDARVLFRLLDTDESGEITIDEFIVGCYKLQGESRSLDLKIMQLDLEAVRGYCDEMRCMVKEMKGYIVPESESTPSLEHRLTKRHPDAPTQSWQEIMGVSDMVKPPETKVNNRATAWIANAIS